MDVNVLIDSIVRQTTVLIAQIATAGGGRASLAHTANQVFAALARELKAQGVSSKVVADMFGLALRTYHAKMQRLGESNSHRGKSLWEAVLEYVRAHESLLQSEILVRFQYDDHVSVKGVLADLVESGLVFKAGRSHRAVYRAATPDEINKPGTGDPDALPSMILVALNRLGAATQAAISDLVPAPAEDLARALDKLAGEGLIEVSGDGDERTYRSDGCFIPVGAETGWEAAVFDHYQAVVTAIGTKLRLGSSRQGEHVGGSTYNFWIWRGHPLEEEVLALLERFRRDAADLRRRVAEHNHADGRAEDLMTRVVTYVGQAVLPPDAPEDSP